MKTTVNGYNLHITEPILAYDILALDGFKLHKVDLFITGIESRGDVDVLIEKLRVMKESFIKQKRVNTMNEKQEELWNDAMDQLTRNSRALVPILDQLQMVEWGRRKDAEEKLSGAASSYLELKHHCMGLFERESPILFNSIKEYFLGEK